ncbi:MAG: hypothetical protein DRR04_03770 [Gammaproteobacteria bacterium]|nr:MAG: hypothetical protein DRR04_03770 [Gammaproteobacteria bacterium]
MPRQYVDLLSSLPYQANPFVHRRPPISAVQLEKRLTMLDFQDRNTVRSLARIFYWGRLELHDSDEAIVRDAQRVTQNFEPEDMREWLFWRMDFRTVVAALRRRHAGHDAPAANTLWGFGHYVHQIERNWGHPSFHLESRFPWLTEARNLLEADDCYGLERLLLSTVWNYYSRQVPDVAFSLSAVWLYLSQWDLVERWCSYNAEQAKTRFDDLVASGLEQPLQELRKIA